MAIAAASMTVVAGVPPLNAIAPSAHAHLASGSRLGGIRLNNAALGGVDLRSQGRSATGVVRAEKSVTDKVQDVADGTSREVQKSAGGLKGLFQNLFGKKSQAKSAGKDAQKRAQKLGDQAADAARDLEGSTKNAGSDAENLGAKSKDALEDAGDSLKRSLDDASNSAQAAGQDISKQAESAGAAALDTARELKRDV